MPNLLGNLVFSDAAFELRSLMHFVSNELDSVARLYLIAGIDRLPRCEKYTHLSQMSYCAPE